MSTRHRSRSPDRGYVDDRASLVGLHVRDHFPHPKEATVLVYTYNLAPVLGAAIVHSVIGR